MELDIWFSERANPPMHRTMGCRPVDRLIDERSAMMPLSATAPDVDRRRVLRLPPDRYLRFDTCDYPLDPRLAGRPLRRARATARTSRSPWPRRGPPPPPPVFARHRTITALEHARAVRDQRTDRRGEPIVDGRPLDRYDALIA